VSLEVYDRLVGAIYEAALDARKWDDALMLIASEYAPSYDPNACMMWEHSASHDVRFVATANIDPTAQTLYAASMATANPLTQSLQQVAIGSVVDTDDIVQRDRLKRSPFYKYYLQQRDFERFIAAVVDARGGERLICFMCGNDSWDVEPAVRGMRALAPHLQRATRISLKLGETGLMSAANATALDQAPSGIITLREDLGLVTANEAGRRVIETGAVQVRDGRVYLSDAGEQARLLSLASAPPPTTMALKVPRKTAGPSGYAGDQMLLAMRIASQTQDVVRGVLEGAAIVLVTGREECAPLIDPSWSRAWWNLTETETAIAESIARGMPVLEIAEVRAISENAVRFHLKSIFSKTGVSSQPQLAALLARAPRLSG
jgi:DNA-binding CsgD family transcriptional regulator